MFGYQKYFHLFYPGSSLFQRPTCDRSVITRLAQYNLTNSKAYLLGGLGLAIAKASVDFNTTIPGFESSYSGSSTEFGLTLGGGFKMSPNFNLEGRFNLISDANSLSANLVYMF